MRPKPLLRIAVLALFVAGCASNYTPQAPSEADLSAALLRKEPAAKAGHCFASDTTPAVIETVTEQVVVTPAVQDESGAVTMPATFRSIAQQKIVKNRETVYFRTPCPEDLTMEYIATLQRALKARGYYLLPLTGQMDAETRDAVRRFQEPLGLDSPVLSLSGARNLGITAADINQL